MRRYKIDREDKNTYPLGVTAVPGGIHVSAAADAKECSLALFVPGRKKPSEKIAFPPENRTGDVWEMTVLGEDLDRYEYALEADGKLYADPFGRAFSGREQWGKMDKAHAHAVLRARICAWEPFDWEGDRPLHIPYEDCVVYHAHVRGLTKHASSGTAERGTFAAVAEKIPHLKDLGITTLELMPVTEFPEVMMSGGEDGNPYATNEPTGRLNYWGYAPSLFFAPKASYAGAGKSPVTELKKLVKALHRAGIELVLELYFDGTENPAAVLDAVRYWVREYHLDGIHLMGQAPAWLLERDPYLADTKLWAPSWDAPAPGAGHTRHLGEYNEGFQNEMRQVLKGDEDQINRLIYHTKHNPASCGAVNYIANTNGFTMMDMVSYDRKHNEANGEGGRDGSEHDYSWNCGVEGPTRKKKYLELRKKQIRNAFLLVLLSQGTPLLLAGDEFGNSQGGNNNAYCQDNDTSWLNWNQLRTNRDIYEFAKHAIAFRKAHPVFHMASEPRVMDYLACGHPDVSYHGVNAWRPEFENFRRQLGILYCGEYGHRPDGTLDDDFFVLYNMHWEPHEFALPNLPKGRIWRVAFNTDDQAANGYYPEGQEPELENQKQFMVRSRSIVVLTGKQPGREVNDAHI